MSTKGKILISIGIILFIFILLFIIKLQYDSIQKFKAIDNSLIEMKKLNDDAVRSESNYATSKQLEEFAKKSGLDIKEIKDDLKTIDSELRGVNKVIVVTPGAVQKDVPSTDSVPVLDEPPACQDGVCADPYGHLTERQVLRLREPLSDGRSFALGDVSFSTWKKNPWDVTILPKKYSIINTLGVSSDGRHSVYTKVMVESDGETVTLPISNAEFLEIFPEKKFSFVPRMYLGADIGWSSDEIWEFSPNILLSLFNYGMLKDNPDLMFLAIGAGYGTQGKKAIVHLNPISYNIGKHIPFSSDLFIGPSGGIDFSGGIYITLGVRSGL